MAASARFAQSGDMTLVLIAHAAATWAMVGLIWFVQVVHYPLFASVGETGFVRYENAHTRRTSFVVGVFMPLEAITAVWLVFAAPDGVSTSLVVAGLILLAALWVSTAFWQAPLHGRLSAGYDAALQRRLVTSNWLRTAVWTIRGALVLVMLDRALGA